MSVPALSLPSTTCSLIFLYSERVLRFKVSYLCRNHNMSLVFLWNPPPQTFRASVIYPLLQTLLVLLSSNYTSTRPLDEAAVLTPCKRSRRFKCVAVTHGTNRLLSLHLSPCLLPEKTAETLWIRSKSNTDARSKNSTNVCREKLSYATFEKKNMTQNSRLDPNEGGKDHESFIYII